MPRRNRVIVAGTALHIVQRGHNRGPTFRFPEEFARYRDVLQEAGHRFSCALHAYVLMSNHVHLLITPNDVSGPARMMQLVGRRYVPWINGRYRRSGTLWDGRYWSSVVDGGRYLWACIRYIERNPVRAGMVDHPAAYPWSSHRCNAFGESDSLISPHALYLSLGATADVRQAAYRALFRDDDEPAQLAVVRSALRRGLVLGDHEFVAGVDAVLGRATTPLKHGGDRRSPAFRRVRVVDRDELQRL